MGEGELEPPPRFYAKNEKIAIKAKATWCTSTLRFNLYPSLVFCNVNVIIEISLTHWRALTN